MFKNIIISAPVLANILGISKRRVYQLVKEEIIPKGNGGRYDLSLSIQGYLCFLKEKSHVSLSESKNTHKEKVRLMKAQAEKIEMEVALLRGEMVLVDSVCIEIEKMVKAFRERALSIPNKITPIIFNQNSQSGVRSVLNSEINELLSELSEYPPIK